VFDPVGEFSRTDEIQRRRRMQTDAEEPIETGKMIHVGVRYEGVADAQELPR
jgi:hypothetical protein